VIGGPRRINVATVQAASDRAGVQQLLAALGYDTSEPSQQTAASLGVAERSQHLIRNVCRVAAERLSPGLPPALEVYCFETTALTVELRKALVAAFRNKPANALLIAATRDFDPLDFVLVEKESQAGGPGGARVAVSHRLVSVDRRHPSPVHLRVLERMSRAAIDPYAQFERIRDAFRLAEWSEDEFNNRGLFSDYFLKSRLPDARAFPVWNTDLRGVHQELMSILSQAGDVRQLNTKDMHAKLVIRTLATLGFKADALPKDDEADFLLRPGDAATDSPAVAGLLAYPWDRPLDRQDDLNRDRADHVPGIRVVGALEKHKVPWAILTNGKDWRLYCAAAHSRASNYYEVELPEALARDDLVALRYFWLFFRAASFSPLVPAAGEPGCFLDQVRLDSQAFAKEVGDRLRGRIFDEVFPYLAEGFVQYRRSQFDEKTDAGDEFLGQAYDATLTLLYRLLFLLYAESLDLLPVHEPAFAAVSLTRLKQEMAEAAGEDTDAVDDQLKRRYTKSDTGLWQRLGKLFQVIAEGSRQHNVPAYNGGLFRMAPDRDDQSREAKAARFLKKHRVPDFFLARALDLMAREEDPKTQELVFVDYRSLGVRQLGTIYEGLLMYHVVVPRDDWERGFRRPNLRVALVPSNQQRKSTGSYFTPPHIVKYIVTNTVGPLLDEKFAAVAPKLREAQRWFADKRKFEDKKAQQLRSQPPTDEQIARWMLDHFEPVVWDLLDLKVLDPAMGSAHFLVETVDYITDRVLHFLAGFPTNPVQVVVDQRIRRQILDALDQQEVKINEERLTDVNLIKRLVMKRCVYGVDLNPMAVELAKVSLWLDSFTLGAPLSFLDHHLKCGNSLIGATIEDLKRAAQGWVFGIKMEPLQRATAGLEVVANLTDATLSEVGRSAETYKNALVGVRGYRALLDCLTAEHFGVPGASELISHGSDLDLDHWDAAVKSLHAKDRRWIEQAEQVSRQRAFFHWDVDFPDVFFTSRRPEELRRFDAVVGNPPYDRLSAADLGEEIEVDKVYFKSQRRFQTSASKEMNLWRLFLSQVLGLPCSPTRFSMIIPMGLLADDSAVDLRKHLLANATLCQVEAFPQKDDPKNRVFEEAKLSTMVFVMKAAAPCADHRVVVRCHPGKSILTDSPAFMEFQPTFFDFEPHNCPIPRCSAVEWELAKRLTIGQESGRVRTQRMRGFAHHYEGEVPQKKPLGLFGSSGAGPRVLRGAHVGRYGLQDARQGEELFLILNRFAKTISGDDTRATHVEGPRVVYQEGAPEDNYRRLIPAMIPSGQYVGHTVHYVPESECSCSLSTLLALLASSFSEWFFDLVSSNNHVSQYKVYAFPIPAFREDQSRRPAGSQSAEDILTKAGEVLRQQPASDGSWDSKLGGSLALLADEMCELGNGARICQDQCRRDVSKLATTEDIDEWTGVSAFRDLDYFGWEGRFPQWQPDEQSVEEGRWYPNGVSPPLEGEGPGEIPWELIARVYPSYPLPGIDAGAWEQAAWDDLCDLLRKNKTKIGNSRVRADLTGSGPIAHPTGALRQLRETFLDHHRRVRANRARAAELDFLIDRIVFRLFDLTLDEQRLILSRVGPGRPLPPRRGGKRKRAANAGDGNRRLFEMD
jgi:hypothetical protein